MTYQSECINIDYLWALIGQICWWHHRFILFRRCFCGQFEATYLIWMLKSLIFVSSPFQGSRFSSLWMSCTESKYHEHPNSMIKDASGKELKISRPPQVEQIPQVVCSFLKSVSCLLYLPLLVSRLVTPDLCCSGQHLKGLASDLKISTEEHLLNKSRWSLVDNKQQRVWLNSEIWSVFNCVKTMQWLMHTLAVLLSFFVSFLMDWLLHSSEEL